MDSLDMKYMGPLLKTARLNANLTQEKLAEILGVTPRYIMSIENEGRCPALELWLRMIRVLHISADIIAYPGQMFRIRRSACSYDIDIDRKG